MNVHQVGVLGTGRLGRALAPRLRERFAVSVYDTDVRLAKQHAKQHDLTFRYADDLLAEADVLVLCVPPEEIVPVLRGVEDGAAAPPVCVNTATSVDTPNLVRELGLRRTKVVGLKPVGQFTAIHHRLPVVFVTASAGEDLALLRQVFGGIGDVCTGEELRVGDLNRVATTHALRFCQDLLAAVRPLAGEESWARSALHSVAAGTILDFPPAEDNDYTRRLLAEIAADRAGCPR